MKIKRLFWLFVAMALLSSSAMAAVISVDTDAATLEELLDARSSIERAILSRDDYKQVTVPSGSYIVGEQIPAGEYSVSTNSMLATVTVYDDSKLEGMYVLSDDDGIGRLVLKDGYEVQITNAVIFSPYAGLGF